MKKFFKDLLNPSGEVSSKRFTGLIGFAFFITGVILNIDTDSLRWLGTLSAALLGLGILEGMFKK